MEYISVGKLVKPHGIHGALQFVFHGFLKDDAAIPNFFFIQRNGMYTPLFVEKLEMNREESGFVHFEEFKDRNQAILHSNLEMYLSEQDADKYFEEDESDLEFLIGYTAFDNETEFGTIIAIDEMPMQTFAVVENGEKEHLIPLVDDFVIDIVKKKKQIIFDLPEGLLDL
jgi:16S rRNA processing protein RimM